MFVVEILIYFLHFLQYLFAILIEKDTRYVLVNEKIVIAYNTP